MRPLRSRILFEVIVGVVLVTSLVVILRQARRIAEYQHRQEADAQSLRLLREAVAQKGLHVPPPEVTEESPTEGELSAIAKREATIERLDRELAEAQANITNLQSQLTAANDQSTQAQASAQATLQKQQEDSKAQLDDLQKKLDAALQQSDIARQRAAALEADNARLTATSSTTSAQTADVYRILANLEELDHRRDAYLTSILRRYRDLSSDFRNMGSMLDTSHDPNHEASAGACGGAALSRIQNAVNSAEDDLRQINDLNARSLKLLKQLPKK
jgi:chromosome segregation ATPase